MRWLFSVLMPSGRWLAALVCAMGVLHILAVLATPQLSAGQAHRRLTAGMALHTMTILPPITPSSQKLPFMTADALYAVCPYDTQKGPVAITATLPAPGWALALYSSEGANFYVSVAQPNRPTTVSLLLSATDDRFTGLTPQALGLSPRDETQLKVPADKGFVLLRAPDQGLAYRKQNLATLRSARCAAEAANPAP
ncbi:MAG: hypothetical protein ABL894_12685 [Hyphomicrobium sp.]